MSRDASRSSSHTTASPAPAQPLAPSSKPGARTRVETAAPRSSGVHVVEPGHVRARRVLELLELQVATLAAALARQDFFATRTAAETCRALRRSLDGAMGDAERDPAFAAEELAQLAARADRLTARLDELLPQAPPSSLGLGLDLVDPGAELDRQRSWEEQRGNRPRAPADRGEASSHRDAPYRWIRGTYQIDVSSAWLRASPDKTYIPTSRAASSDALPRFASPPRVRELLLHLRTEGLLWWITDEELEAAVAHITLPLPPADTARYPLDISLGVFHAVGLPPGRDVMFSVSPDGALHVVMSLPEVDAARGTLVTLSAARRRQLIEAIERFTGLAMLPRHRARLLTSPVSDELGGHAVHLYLRRAQCEKLFGGDAYAGWLERRADRKASDASSTKGDAAASTNLLPYGTAGADAEVPAAAPPPASPATSNAAQPSQLSDDERAWAERWLLEHVASPADRSSAPAASPVVVDRPMLATVRAIEAHPDREHILQQLHRPRASLHSFNRQELERAIEDGVFEAERARTVVVDRVTPQAEEPREPVRPPLFDLPLPAVLQQRNGLVRSGELVRYVVEIHWPRDITPAQRSELNVHPHHATCDWVFERAEQPRQHFVTRGHELTLQHALSLGPEESAAVWTLHAFVRHSHFRPAHLTTQIEVKSEQRRLAELRAATFDELGQYDHVELDHDFDTSAHNEVFGDEGYDKGLRFSGTAPATLQRRSPAERQHLLDRDLTHNERLLAYLRKDGRYPDAIAATQHYVARLRDARASLAEDVADGWKPFEARGFYFGHDKRLPEGKLELLGAAKELRGARGNRAFQVQLRDLSRRLSAEYYRFEGTGETFEQALELAFVELCKKYPPGRVSMLGEELGAAGRPTGKTLGFELQTGTAWKDVKEVFFAPAVSLIVNIAASISMLMFPFCAPILMPALIAYNASQTVDHLVDEWTSGTLTPGKAAMHSGSMLLDILPYLHNARVLTTSRLGFALFEGVNWGGQGLLMTLQARDLLAQLRDQDIAELALHHAELLELERTTHPSDPALATKRAELEARARKVSARSTQVLTQLIGDFLITTVPIQTVAHLRMAQARGAAAVGDDDLGTPLRRRRSEDGSQGGSEDDSDARPDSGADDRTDGGAQRTHEEEHGRVGHSAEEPDLAGELQRGGALDAQPIQARPIAGSRLQGRRGVADDAGARVTEARRAIPAAAAQVEPIMSIDPTIDPDTFVLRFPEGAPISVRVSAGPLDGHLPARTVANPTKIGVNELADPARAARPAHATHDEAPEHLTVEGRYVIQLSSSLDPAHTERALVHELAVIVAEREQARARLHVGGDLLVRGAAPRAGATPSPTDRGHLAELTMLADEAARAAAAQDDANLHELQRELHALIDHLGLREGTPGARARRQLVAPLLPERARQMLTHLGRRADSLPGTARRNLEIAHGRAAREQAAQTQRAQEQRPLHELPIARANGERVERVSPEEAALLAEEAALRRAAASAATLARLRAEAAQLAPSGRYPVVESPQLGGGAALAARVPDRLFVDRRGRWQADPSEHIAQTASQLRGLREAGLGDPSQFAAPDERVPLAAVRFWEDTIAAQGPVIDGAASLQLGGDGRLLLHVDPGDGSARVTLEVRGTPLVATGFPPEHIPGAPRGLTPDRALSELARELEALQAAAADTPALAARLSAARDELAAIAAAPGQGAREPELAKAREILQRHQLEPLVGKGQNADALKMILAGDQWHALRTQVPGRVLLGDEANLSSLDPTATDDWVIAGTGGTGVSAAEIIFRGNPRAHVTMAGRNAPPGLLENDQFRGLLAKHGDAASVAAVQAQGGPALPPGDGRLTVMFGVDAGIPQMENGQLRIAGSGPFDPKDPLVGGGYIAALGRGGQLPPVLATMNSQAKQQGLEIQIDLLVSDDNRYLGYRATLYREQGMMKTVIHHIDITGAASRFLPWELIPERQHKNLQRKLNRAGDLDAPSEGGNFDGGLASSSSQASQYGKWRRTEEM